MMERSNLFLYLILATGAAAFVTTRTASFVHQQISSVSTRRHQSNFLSSSQTPTGLRSSTSTSNDELETSFESLGLPARPGRPLTVAVAGGGVGGLTAALCMLKRGFDVTVYERTAAFARFGGPIQFASNALSVLKEVDETLFERVMSKFTFTGTRTCGIKDGLRSDGSFRMTDDSVSYLWDADAPADWFVKFPLKVSRFYFFMFETVVFINGSYGQYSMLTTTL